MSDEHDARVARGARPADPVRDAFEEKFIDAVVDALIADYIDHPEEWRGDDE